MAKQRTRPSPGINTVKAASPLMEPKKTEPKQTDKSPRTLLLHDASFQAFQRICKSLGRKPAHFIDAWIADFLARHPETGSKRERPKSKGPKG